MAITWADILTWTTGPLESAATDLTATSKALVSAASDGQDATNAIQSQGSAVTAIRSAASKNMTALARLATNVNSALMAIEGAYDGVAKVMANIQNAQAYAAENYCTINSDGSVSSHADNESDSVKTQAMLAADHLKTTIEQIIKDADQVDTDLYHAMSDINNDRATDGDKGGDNKVIGVPDHPNKNWSPSQNAAWWNSLSDNQKQYLTEHCPEEIRHLDGLPISARDLANRNVLNGYVDKDGVTQRGALENIDIAYDAAVTARDNARKAYYDATTDSSVDAETLRKITTTSTLSLHKPIIGSAEIRGSTTPTSSTSTMTQLISAQRRSCHRATPTQRPTCRPSYPASALTWAATSRSTWTLMKT